MKRGARWAALCGVALLAALAVAAQLRIDAARASVEDELLYLPNEKLLNHFTCGMDSIIADFLWLRCIQYTATQLKGDRAFTWLNHMLNTCVRLDPYFKDVYRYGGIFLASLRADDDAGLRLLEKGAVQVPDAWELPYEMAMIYLLNRKDEPGSRERARRYLAMSADTGHAPAYVADLVDKLRAAGDISDTAIEREMWEKLAQSEDRLLRDMAARKLEELAIREYCRALTEEAAAYARRTRRPVQNLEELLRAGVITQLPVDPLGGRFFIDADGVVRNTTLLDEDTRRRETAIRNAIEKFRRDKGRWAASLDELVQPGYLALLPEHPYPGRTWQYDPASGTLR